MPTHTHAKKSKAKAKTNKKIHQTPEEEKKRREESQYLTAREAQHQATPQGMSRPAKAVGYGPSELEGCGSETNKCQSQRRRWKSSSTTTRPDNHSDLCPQAKAA